MFFQGKEEGLKMNWVHQVLAYADDVNIVAKKYEHHKVKHRSCLRYYHGVWFKSESNVDVKVTSP
jgi:hypothetical protein